MQQRRAPSLEHTLVLLRVAVVSSGLSQRRGRYGHGKMHVGMTHHEEYTLRDNPAFAANLAMRSASQCADFFLPYLAAGMDLLDCGCGPGSITLDLAEVLSSGSVVGLDIDASSVAMARAAQQRRGCTNARFQVGDLRALPFPDESFDAVFLHVVLCHLRDPVLALKEVRRVLRPGGRVGVRDPDWGSALYAPANPVLDDLFALQVRVLEHCGASPFYARKQRALLHEAGFSRSEASAFALHSGTREQTQLFAATELARLRGPVVQKLLREAAFVTTDELASMEQALREWAERADAFYALTLCSAVGWVDA